MLHDIFAMHDWPVLVVGFPMLIIGVPAGAMLGRYLGRNIPQED